MAFSGAQLSLKRTFSDILEDQLLINYNQDFGVNNGVHSSFSNNSNVGMELDYANPTMLLNQQSSAVKGNLKDDNIFNQYADPSLTTLTKFSDKNVDKDNKLVSSTNGNNNENQIVQTISLTKLMKSQYQSQSQSQSQSYSNIDFNNQSKPSNNNKTKINNTNVDFADENNNILFTQNNSLYDDEFNLYLSEQQQLHLNNSKENLISNNNPLLQDNNILLNNEDAKTIFNNELYNEDNDDLDDDDILSDDDDDDEEEEEENQEQGGNYFDSIFKKTISNDNMFALQSFMDSDIKNFNTSSSFLDENENDNENDNSRLSILEDDLNDSDIYDFSKAQYTIPTINNLSQNKNNRRKQSFVKKNKPIINNNNLNSTITTNTKSIKKVDLPNTNGTSNSTIRITSSFQSSSASIISKTKTIMDKIKINTNSDISTESNTTAVESITASSKASLPAPDSISVESNHTHSSSNGHDVFKCMIMNLITNEPCSAEFSRPYDLTRHQNTIHAKRKIVFRCSECIKSLGDDGFKKTFSRLDALTRHIKSKHEELSMEQKKQVTNYAKQNIGYVMG